MLNEKQIDRMLSKLKRYEDTLDAMIFEKVADLPVSFYQTGESLYEIPDESLFAPMAVGSHWGGEGVYGWFRTGWQVPKELAGRPLFLRPKVGGYEALLWVDGKPFGTFATKIVVTGHGNHYCDMVVKNPKAGQEIAIDLEFYTGHFVRGCFPFEETGRTDYDFVYESMEICVKNEKVANFLFNLRTLNQLAEVLDDRSYRKAELINVLTALHETVYYDPSCISREEFENSLLEGQRIMAPALARRAPLSAPKAGVIGHSHMDTAWLWHVGETIKKCARTYSNQLNLMEQYPEYKFVQSSAYHGEMIRQHYPELFERIRKKVQEGRYEPNGGVWVECDCNITSGESMIRQFLWGQRFTKKYYNYLSDAFWLPDTFGYSAAIPQIMKGCGVKYFLTTKMAWNDTNQFPYDTFWWKGIDGTQVLAHLNKTHVWPEPKAFYEYLYDTKSPDAVRQKYVSDRKLISYGFGDGGGGPQYEMVEMARRCRDLEGCPRTEHTTVSHFMQELEQNIHNPSTYEGELYLELHRGTLTAKQQIKKNNRMAENLLRMLELCLTRSAVTARTPADGTALRPLWNTLLVNQFHDILPGSCIAAANDRSLHDMAEMLHAGSELLRSWFAPAQNCYTVLNPLDEPCRDVFYLPQIASGFIAQEPGVTLQNVVLADGTAATAVYGLERPALGAAVLHFVPGEQPAQTSRFVYDGKTLTTPLLQVQLDELGRITSLVTRADGMQWTDGPMNTLLMAEDVSAGWDGWDIDADCMMKLQPAARLTKQTVTADGPQEFRLHSRYELGTATILEQDMIFRAESTLVEWQTVLHWNEKHRVLKAAFPTNLRAKTARHEIQFGYIERPTTANDTREQAMFERCNHRYTDLSEPGRGLSIFNDCKYGISVQGGTMALTLAKGGTRPDERGDVGTYTFRYAIQPHAEGFSAKVPRRGMRFDRLPTVLAADAPSPALLTTSCRNVVVETVKPCEDAQNAMIVRLYECEGSHTAPVALHPGFAVTAAHQCDMAENAQFSVDLTNLAPFKPFEVRTVKIEY